MLLIAAPDIKYLIRVVPWLRIFNLRCPTPALLLFGLSMSGVFAAETGAAKMDRFMPRAEDYALTWWEGGYAPTVRGDNWQRVVRTGHYAFVFDTKNLAITRLGAAAADKPLGELPSAQLELTATVDGKTYRAVKSADPTRFSGPRLIESGTFLQRADVTDLVFQAADGALLSQQSRFETAAWPQRLGLKLAMRPGLLPIAAGESCFGKIQGGFGLTADSRLDIPAEDCATPEKFTLSFWYFAPPGVAERRRGGWLVCKNRNEATDGHYGMGLDANGKVSGTINIGGGRNSFTVSSGNRRVLPDRWNHLALSYDGDILRLYVNGHAAGEIKVGRPRQAAPGGLAFGDRQDGAGKGIYRVFGAVDEIRIHDRALTPDEIKTLERQPGQVPPPLAGIRQWTFRSDVAPSPVQPSEQWKSASLDLRLSVGGKNFASHWELPPGQQWTSPQWHEVSLAIDPVKLEAAGQPAGVTVVAAEAVTGKPCPVAYDPAVGWFVVGLNDVAPVPPAGQKNPTNDAMQRVFLTVSNTSGQEQIVPLMFEKAGDKGGFRQALGASVTGLTAMLRDKDGHPTGLPVQPSKNWHSHPEAGVYSGQWFHGASQLRVPPGETVELELSVVFGHWGGLPAASHAQLSLIGWGGNQLWDQSALGSWGESICYDPDQNLASCTITDVRPVLVRDDSPMWHWTLNHGGGDFFRFFDASGNRVPHSGMRARYLKTGPCLTEVVYEGQIHNTGIGISETVSLPRTDDLVRGIYRISMKVTKPVDFSRFVIFQIGADSYLSTREKKYAIGNPAGVVKEWEARWGGDSYHGEAVEAAPGWWVSLHDVLIPEGETGARANRGLVIRDWKARLGGKEVPPYIAEHGISRGPTFKASTIDIVPPPGLHRLEPGDYVEATIEHLVVPRLAHQYYGPNEDFRAALTRDENTWKMVHRQAAKGALSVTPVTGRTEQITPDVRVATENDVAEFTIEGGVGFIPVTFTGLGSHRDYQLTIDGQPFDQGVHGNDFWQTNFDSASRKWSRTYNIPSLAGKKRTLRLAPAPPPPAPTPTPPPAAPAVNPSPPPVQEAVPSAAPENKAP